MAHKYFLHQPRLWVGLGGAGLALVGVGWDASIDSDYVCVFLKCLLGEQNAKTD